MRKNDEAQRTKDEGMTKSETLRDEFDEAFWNDATAPMIREEPTFLIRASSFVIRHCLHHA